MRIAFVIQDLFSQGAQYATALMVRGFISKGYDVDLIVSKFHADLLAEGKKPFAIPESARVMVLANRRASRNIRELRRYLKATDSSAVIAMCSTYVEALAMAAIGLRRRPKLIAIEHGITFGLREDWSLKPRLRLFSRRGLMMAVVRHAIDRWGAVSARVAEEMTRVYGISREKIDVVYNPATDEEFFKLAAEGPQHPWLREKKCKTIVTGGSFTDDKNHLLLIEAVHRVNETQQLRLIIYGKGPLQEKYESLIRKYHLEDVVSLPGFTHNLPAEIKASDGYVCSSQIESFAIAPVQAMACGVPVICCDCPCGPREILADGKYGRLVPTGDVEAMTAAVRDLAHGKIPVAPAEVWQRFSVERITERYERAIGMVRLSDVQWLQPYKRSSYQFFQEWATEAWRQGGGSVRRCHQSIPWKLKMIIAKLGLAFSLPKALKSGKRLILPCGGWPAYWAWPWCYRYEIIPLMWDCWPKYWPKLPRSIRRLGVRKIFCTSSQTAAYIREQCPEIDAVWIPEGIKVEEYPMGPALSERQTDVMRFGRDVNGKLLYPTQADLTAAMRDAKVMICRPRCDTHPDEAGNLETLTQRYWEGMLSGCVIVGRAPRELVDFCGYNPVLSEMPEHPEDYQGLVDRNRKFAEEHAGWDNRMSIIRKTLGLK